jgi:hypothetical protein
MNIAKNKTLIINHLIYFPLQFPLQKPQLSQAVYCPKLSRFFAYFHDSIAILLHFSLVPLQVSLQISRLQTHIPSNA